MTLRPGIELATTGSEVQRPNRCATKTTHDIVYLMYEAPDISTGLQDISPATLKFLMASIRSARSRQQLLSVPRVRRSMFGSRAFSVAGPTVWNSLSDDLLDPAFQLLTLNIFGES